MADSRDLFTTVDKLLADAKLPTAEKIAGEKADEFRQRIGDQLIVISNARQDEVDAGGAKVIIGGKSLRIGGTVWPLLACIVTFVAAPFDPSGLTYGAAGAAIINALEKIGKNFHTLDPAQRVVCRAVIEIIDQKR